MGPIALAAGVLILAHGPVGVDVALFVLIGLTTLFAAWLVSRRQRAIAIGSDDEAHVVRAEAAGPPFRLSSVRPQGTNKVLTLVYLLLGAGMANAGFKAFQSSPALGPVPSAGQIAERLTGMIVGLVALTICGLAVWRRARCTRVKVPPEKHAFWVRDDDLPRLGLNDANDEPLRN